MAEEVTRVTTPRKLEIRKNSDVGQAQCEMASLAQAVGFSTEASNKIGAATGELAQLLFEKTSNGTLVLKPIHQQTLIGVEAVSTPDILKASPDAPSSTQTPFPFGKRLSQVSSVMDDVEVTVLCSSASRIVCRAWLPPSPADAPACRLRTAVMTRSLQEMNGDLFVVKRWPDHALFGVIDGLGHGEPAYQAALAAREYVDANCELPLGRLFRGVATACRGTRGVVMALVGIDCKASRLSVASVGNIEVRLHPSGLSSQLSVRRGILGLNAPSVQVTDLLWKHGTMLVMHSDGLHTRWSWRDFPNLQHHSSIAATEELFLKQAKPQDDATVMVVRNEGC